MLAIIIIMLILINLGLCVYTYVASSYPVARVDRPRYRIWTLLAFTKIEELTFPVFRKFVMEETAIRAHSFLSFTFGDAQLKPGGWLSNQLATVFDYQYVEDNLLSQMRSFLPQMQTLLQDLTKKVEGPQIQEFSITTDHKSTVPVPFNLTETKFRPLPLPTVVMQAEGFKAVAVPESTYNVHLVDIMAKGDQRKAEIRAEAIKAQEKASKNSFKFSKSHSSRPVTKSEPKHVIKAKPVPKYPAAPEVRQTAGDILRAELLFKKKAEAEAARLRRLEEELRDESEFYEWKRQEEAKDDKAREEMIKARKAELIRVAEVANEAREALVEENKKAAIEMKKQDEIDV